MELAQALFVVLAGVVTSVFIVSAVAGYDGTDDKLKKLGWTIKKTQFNGNVYSKGDLKTDKITALEFEKIQEKEELGFVDPPKKEGK